MSADAILAALDAAWSVKIARRAVSLTWANSIPVRPTKWLYADRMPLGALSLIAGREGMGKSTWAYGRVADITQGRLPGVYEGIPKTVIIAATEDSWSQTIIPRLMASDADLERVARIDVTTSEGVGGYLSLPSDLAAVDSLIIEHDVALVLLDPLLSRLDGDLDTHKDSEVRRALEPLVASADRAGAAVWGLIHLNKSSKADPLSQVMGSRAFVAVPRAALIFARDPDDESIVLMGQPRNNLGRTDLPTMRYRIEPLIVAETEEGPVWATRMVEDGESTTTIDDALGEGATGDRTAAKDAAAWLEDFLESQGGTAEAPMVKKEATKAGHTVASLQRARKLAGVTYETKGFPRKSWWSLPQSSHPVVSPVGESEINGMNGTTATTDAQSFQSFHSFQSWQKATGTATTATAPPDNPRDDDPSVTPSMACPECGRPINAARRPLECLACPWRAADEASERETHL